MSFEPFTITNEKICAMYNANPEMFTAFNLCLADFVEQLNSKNATIGYGEIINAIKQVQNQIGNVKENVTSIKENMNNIKDVIALKFHEINKEYMDNIRYIITSTQTNSIDKITNLLNSNSELFVSKIGIILPQNANDIQKYIQTNQQQMIQDIKLLFKENGGNVDTISSALKDYANNTQQTMCNYMNSNYGQVATQLTNITENSAINQKLIERIETSVSDFVNKQNYTSTLIGKEAETKVNAILEFLYDGSSVMDVTSTPHNGDFVLTRPDKPQILIETKMYKHKVPTSETDFKFKPDVINANCHGLFMSQISDIVGKPDYTIEIINGKNLNQKLIMIYISNVDFCPNKIKSATNLIDMLDILYKKCNDINPNNVKTIEIDRLNIIQKELSLLVNSKNNLIKSTQEFCDKQIKDIRQLTMDELDRVFVEFGMSSVLKPHKCQYCTESFADLKGLATHSRVHDKKVASSIPPLPEFTQNVIVQNELSASPPSSVLHTCEVCKKTFPTNAKFSAHKRWSTSSGTTCIPPQSTSL